MKITSLLKIILFAIAQLTFSANKAQSQTPIVSIYLYKVGGIVHDKYNFPLQNVDVKLYDKDLRKEKLLAEKHTDVKGSYGFTFKDSAPLNPEYLTADLFIRVFDTNGNLLGQSDIYYNVGEMTIINYTVGNLPFREVNEFDTLYKKIRQFVNYEGLTLGELNEVESNKDITFISNEFSVEYDNILFLNYSFSIAKRGGVSASVYFGLFRTGIRIKNDKFTIPLDSNAITTHLQQAVDQNIISSQILEELDVIIPKLMLLNPTNR